MGYMLPQNNLNVKVAYKRQNNKQNKNKQQQIVGSKIEKEEKYCFPWMQLNSTAKNIQHAIRILQDTILVVHLQSRNTSVHTHLGLIQRGGGGVPHDFHLYLLKHTKNTSPPNFSCR